MKNRILLIAICSIIFINLVSCQSPNSYSLENLPKPDIKGGRPLMSALNDRCSTREFSNKELTPQLISNLLWAANGINRPSTTGRTAPSACNRQEIDIYVALKEGTYLFKYKEQKLDKLNDNDIRSEIGVQEFVKNAPLCLIYVADMNKACGNDSMKVVYSAADAAYVSENVYLFCASENLATVVLGSVKRENVSKNLQLGKEKKVIFAQPVGYKNK